jgi:hypothetical protein
MVVLGTAYCRVGCDGNVAVVWKSTILELMFSIGEGRELATIPPFYIPHSVSSNIPLHEQSLPVSVGLN